MSDTFFITGATGFIGQKLTERLVAAGQKVRCLIRPGSNRETLKKLGVEFVDGDLFDCDALKRGSDGIDYVFHIAGLTRELRRGDFEKVNVVGTKNLANVCAELGAKRFVYVSSLAGAGLAPRARNENDCEEKLYAPRRLRRETDAPKPISPYGKSKFNAEKFLVTLAEKLPISVVRPPYVFGKGDWASLKLYEMVKNDGVIVLPGYFDHYYSFVYVDDLVEFLLAVQARGESLYADSLTSIESNVSESAETCSGVGIYFAADREAIRFSKFGEYIGAGYGRKKTRAVKVPPVGVLGAGVYGEIYKAIKRKYPAFDWNKAIEAVRGPWICSGAKAEKTLGVELKGCLADKIAETAKWYVDRGLIK